MLALIMVILLLDVTMSLNKGIVKKNKGKTAKAANHDKNSVDSITSALAKTAISTPDPPPKLVRVSALPRNDPIPDRYVRLNERLHNSGEATTSTSGEAGVSHSKPLDTIPQLTRRTIPYDYASENYQRQSYVKPANTGNF